MMSPVVSYRLMHVNKLSMRTRTTPFDYMHFSYPMSWLATTCMMGLVCNLFVMRQQIVCLQRIQNSLAVYVSIYISMHRPVTYNFAHGYGNVNNNTLVEDFDAIPLKSLLYQYIWNWAKFCKV